MGKTPTSAVGLTTWCSFITQEGSAPKNPPRGVPPPSSASEPRLGKASRVNGPLLHPCPSGEGSTGLEGYRAQS